MARRTRTWRGRRPLAGAETLGAEPGRACLWPGGNCQVRTVNPRGTTVRHGCRALDSVIVPRPPAHNGCSQGPAETVEGRERAKGNVVGPAGAGPRAGASCHRRSPAYGRHLRGPGRSTRGRSPVRECRTPGSVRGAARKGRPYRDRSARREKTTRKPLTQGVESAQLSRVA